MRSVRGESGEGKVESGARQRERERGVCEENTSHGRLMKEGRQTEERHKRWRSKDGGAEVTEHGGERRCL